MYVIVRGIREDLAKEGGRGPGGGGVQGRGGGAKEGQLRFDFAGRSWI